MDTPAPDHTTLGRRLHGFVAPMPKPKPPIDPALLKHEQERAEARQNRLADRITVFAGSMLFVYIHIIWFGCWIGFGVERYPYGLLTMIVSLEAIFLSTFVMISQNRADAKRQAIADQQWQTVQEEDRQNQELLELSHQILDLTKAIHAVTTPPEAVGASRRQVRNRDPRGVRAHDRVRAAVRLDSREQRLLDVEALDDGLDDPVARRQGREVLIEPAGADERVRCRGKERIGLQLSCPLEPLARDLRCDVEQQRRHAGIREVRRHLRPHRPRAEHRRRSDPSCHEIQPVKTVKTGETGETRVLLVFFFVFGF